MQDEFDLEDGATSQVDTHPDRATFPTKDLATAGASPAGGHLAAARLKADDARRNFLMLRGPLGVVKITFDHAHVLKAVWAVWARKRVEQADDPGATPAEIAEAAGTELAQTRHILQSLLRSRAIRSTTTHVGWRGLRARYYPTAAAVQALAFAEVLPHGSLVQVGRTSKVWKSRQEDSPPDLFQFAMLLRQGGEIQGVEA